MKRERSDAGEYREYVTVKGKRVIRGQDEADRLRREQGRPELAEFRLPPGKPKKPR